MAAATAVCVDGGLREWWSGGVVELQVWFVRNINPG
jgi:hypothetical protein